MLNSWPVVEDEALYVVSEIRETGAIARLTEELASICDISTLAYNGNRL